MWLYKLSVYLCRQLFWFCRLSVILRVVWDVVRTSISQIYGFWSNKEFFAKEISVFLGFLEKISGNPVYRTKDSWENGSPYPFTRNNRLFANWNPIKILKNSFHKSDLPTSRNKNYLTPIYYPTKKCWFSLIIDSFSSQASEFLFLFCEKNIIKFAAPLAIPTVNEALWSKNLIRFWFLNIRMHLNT